MTRTALLLFCSASYTSELSNACDTCRDAPLIQAVAPAKKRPFMLATDKALGSFADALAVSLSCALTLKVSMSEATCRQLNVMSLSKSNLGQ